VFNGVLYGCTIDEFEFLPKLFMFVDINQADGLGTGKSGTFIKYDTKTNCLPHSGAQHKNVANLIIEMCR